MVGVIGEAMELVRRPVDLDHKQDNVPVINHLLLQEGSNATDQAQKPRLVMLRLVQVFMLILRF